MNYEYWDNLPTNHSSYLYPYIYFNFYQRRYVSDEKGISDDNEHNPVNLTHLHPVVLAIDDINSEATLEDQNYSVGGKKWEGEDSR